MEKQFRHPLERPSILIQFTAAERISRLHSLLAAAIRELDADDWLTYPHETTPLEVAAIPELFRALGEALHQHEILDF